MSGTKATRSTLLSTKPRGRRIQWERRINEHGCLNVEQEYYKCSADKERGVKHTYKPWRSMFWGFFEELVDLITQGMTYTEIRSYYLHHPNKHYRCDMSVATIHRLLRRNIKQYYANGYGIWIDGEYVMDRRSREKMERQLAQQERALRTQSKGQPRKERYDRLIGEMYQRGMNAHQIYEKLKTRGEPISYSTVYRRCKELELEKSRKGGENMKQNYDKQIEDFVRQGKNANQIYTVLRADGVDLSRTAVYNRVNKAKAQLEIEQAENNEVHQLRQEVTRLTQIVLEALIQKEQ